MKVRIPSPENSLLELSRWQEDFKADEGKSAVNVILSQCGYRLAEILLAKGSLIIAVLHELKHRQRSLKSDPQC